MQRGSLIRSGRKRDPDVGNSTGRTKALAENASIAGGVGTVCQYPEVDSARKAVTGLLREISSNPLQRTSQSITVAKLCDHFVQRELAWYYWQFPLVCVRASYSQ